MKPKLLLWIGLAAMFAAQIYLPLEMIFQQEKIIAEGKAYRFLTRPIDPIDPFRGAYVRLNFESDYVLLNQQDSTTFKSGDWAYITLAEDSTGFGFLEQAYTSPPEHENYLKIKVRYVNDFQGEYKLYPEIPFDRYYLNEEIAPIAEKEFRALGRNRTQKGYALIKVLAGASSLESVYVGDQKLEDWSREKYEAIQDSLNGI